MSVERSNPEEPVPDAPRRPPTARAATHVTIAADVGDQGQRATETALGIDGEASIPRPGLHPVHRPTLTVTQLDVIGRRSEAAFGRALTEELGSGLAQLRWLNVLVQSSAQRSAKLTHSIGEMTGYTLSGYVQCDDVACRLSLKLTAHGGNIIWAWAEEQPKPLSFAMQDSFVNAATVRLNRELLLIEAEAWRQRPRPRTDDAYALLLQAIPAIYRLEREPFIAAGRLLEQAIAIEPDLALIHSWLAYWHIFYVGQGWAANSAKSMARGGKAAERAITLDPKDARALTIAGHVKAFLGRRLTEAAALHEMALQVNPAFALAWHLSGMTHAYAGKLEEALGCISYCRSLAPGDAHGFFAEAALGIVNLLLHDHEASAAIGRKVTERHPQFTSAYKSYLAALGHLGRLDEAAPVLRRLKVLEPRFSLQRFRSTAPYHRAEDLEHYTSGLRLAGLS